MIEFVELQPLDLVAPGHRWLCSCLSLCSRLITCTAKLKRSSILLMPRTAHCFPFLAVRFSSFLFQLSRLGHRTQYLMLGQYLMLILPCTLKFPDINPYVLEIWSKMLEASFVRNNIIINDVFIIKGHRWHDSYHRLRQQLIDCFIPVTRTKQNNS